VSDDAIDARVRMFPAANIRMVKVDDLLERCRGQDFGPIESMTPDDWEVAADALEQRGRTDDANLIRRLVRPDFDDLMPEDDE